jgi:oligopeptide/dipeptide ABC transporter ATP-binding protein
MAIANDPDVLIADEPTTALDVTTQAQVLEVLQDVRRRTNSALILITHDFGVVAGVADRVVVMYAGKVVETGPVDDVLLRPAHPYTKGLLASMPRLEQEDRRLARIPGQPPSLIDVPSGCAFHPRCPLAHLPDPCSDVVPELAAVAGAGPDDGVQATQAGRAAACHFSDEVVRLSSLSPSSSGGRR